MKYKANLKKVYSTDTKYSIKLLENTYTKFLYSFFSRPLTSSYVQGQNFQEH